MEYGKISVQLRNQTGKGVARRLRRQGLIPGVCYGTALEGPLPIAVSPRELKAALDPQKRHNTVFTMTVRDGDSSQDLVSMVKDYQVDVLTRDLTHIDFVAIDRNKPVEAEVPIELVGKAAGAVEGGQLHVVRHSLRLWCKPEHIPSMLTLDVSPMNIGDVLHVSDIQLPAEVESLDAPRLTIVTCFAQADDDKAKSGDEDDADVTVEDSATPSDAKE